MVLSSAIAHVIITATTIAIIIDIITKYKMSFALSQAIAHVIIITTTATIAIIMNIIIKYDLFALS